MYIYCGVCVFKTTEKVLSLTTDVLQVAPLSRYSVVFLNFATFEKDLGALLTFPERHCPTLC